MESGNASTGHSETQQRNLGVLKVAAVHPNTFGVYESELLGAFLPHATIAVQNAQRTESLQTKMIAAERKHAMADLARGVSHDLNNAMGSGLPSRHSPTRSSRP